MPSSNLECTSSLPFHCLSMRSPAIGLWSFHRWSTRHPRSIDLPRLSWAKILWISSCSLPIARSLQQATPFKRRMRLPTSSESKVTPIWFRHSRHSWLLRLGRHQQSWPRIEVRRERWALCGQCWANLQTTKWDDIDKDHRITRHASPQEMERVSHPSRRLLDPKQ